MNDPTRRFSKGAAAFSSSSDPDCGDSLPLAVPSSSSVDEQLVVAVQEFTSRTEAGEYIDLESFVAEYSHLADPLRECLGGLQIVQAALPAIQAGRHTVEGLFAPDALTAEPLGDYRLLREIGRGGMGVVYEAEQISLGRRVALKILPFAAVLEPRHLQRFKNEALAAASLDHPHIVDVYGVGHDRGVHFYAMRYVEGITLADAIAALRKESASGLASIPAPSVPAPSISDVPRDPQTPPATQPDLTELLDTQPIAALSTLRTDRPADFFRRVAELGAQAAEALDHAHSLGVVHRDIKPSNLLLDHRGHLWVTDFGLALIESDASLTQTGDLLGTLRYMSPEQAEGKSAILDHRTDVYSLGITLYELATRRPAFPESDRQALLHQILASDPPSPRSVDKSIPRDLETIILKAASKDPTDRYPSGCSLAADLRRYASDHPIAARPPSAAVRVWKWVNRHRSVTIVTVISLLLLLLVSTGSAVMLYRSEQAASSTAERLAAKSIELQKSNDQLKHERDALQSRIHHIINRVWQIAYDYSIPREAVEQASTDDERIAVAEDLHQQFPTSPFMFAQLADALVASLEEEAKRPDLPAEYRHALIARRKTRLKEVLATWERHQTNDVATRNQLAWLSIITTYPELRNGPLAVRIAKQLTAEFPGYAPYLNTLALAYYRTGQFQDAADTAQAALDAQIKCPFAYPAFVLALAHARLGNLETAQQHYSAAVEWTDRVRPQSTELRALQTEARALLRVAPRSTAEDDPRQSQ